MEDTFIGTLFASNTPLLIFSLHIMFYGRKQAHQLKIEVYLTIHINESTRGQKTSKFFVGCLCSFLFLIDTICSYSFKPHVLNRPSQ